MKLNIYIKICLICYIAPIMKTTANLWNSETENAWTMEYRLWRLSFLQDRI